MKLNIFYSEPDFDRWAPFDRWPRRWVRRLIRGRRLPGGQEYVFLNLVRGLVRAGLDFRVNDWRWARGNKGAPVGLIGKSHLLNKFMGRHPLLFGASVESHPFYYAEPELPDVSRILVPGDWMADMVRPYWGSRVFPWPVGIDTDRFRPSSPARGDRVSVLIYNKIRWGGAAEDRRVVEPARRKLRELGVNYEEIKYGSYVPQEFIEAISRASGMLFFCEHETQGLAYQEALACDVPILALDEAGPWRDPAYYPERVNFAPVSSVPYWDERCGLRAGSPEALRDLVPEFLEGCRAGRFSPRAFVLENLTLERCAVEYERHYRETFGV